MPSKPGAHSISLFQGDDLGSTHLASRKGHGSPFNLYFNCQHHPSDYRSGITARAELGQWHGLISALQVSCHLAPTLAPVWPAHPSFGQDPPPGQPLIATNITSPENPSHLLLVTYRTSGPQFLMDTWAKVGVIPQLSSNCSPFHAGVTLQAVNNSDIATIGHHSLTLKLGSAAPSNGYSLWQASSMLLLVLTSMSLQTYVLADVHQCHNTTTQFLVSGINNQELSPVPQSAGLNLRKRTQHDCRVPLTLVFSDPRPLCNPYNYTPHHNYWDNGLSMPPPTVTGRSLHGLPDVWPHGWTWHGKHGSGQGSMDKGDGLLAMGTPTYLDFQVLAKAEQEDATQPDIYFISLQLQEVPAPTLSTTLLCDVSTGQPRPHIRTYEHSTWSTYVYYLLWTLQRPLLMPSFWIV